MQQEVKSGDWARYLPVTAVCSGREKIKLDEKKSGYKYNLIKAKGSKGVGYLRRST